MSDHDPIRRTVLRLIGGTAAATGLATAATGQENETENETSESEGDESDRRPIILAGRSEY